jgi:hypothetical protein
LLDRADAARSNPTKKRQLKSSRAANEAGAERIQSSLFKISVPGKIRTGPNYALIVARQLRIVKHFSQVR